MSAGTASQSPDSVVVAVDVMGGDLGPEVVIAGAVRAWRELGERIVLVGDQGVVRRALRSLGVADGDSIRIEHASETIRMDDLPATSIRSKPQSSMRIAYELVRKGEASALVSTGNTGAMVALGVLMSGTIGGIARPAIASLIPRAGDSGATVLVDSGANVDCHAQQLVQFALMGSCYASAALKLRQPRVALLANGSEATKGNDVIRAAAHELFGVRELNYVGFVEGGDIPRDVADVVVCDGLIGNVLLKAMEGSVRMAFEKLAEVMRDSLRGRAAALFGRPLLRKLFAEKLDPSAYGGAPLLGLNHLAVVCHGSANSRAVHNAVRAAGQFVRGGLVDRMREALLARDLNGQGGFGSFKVGS